MDIKEYNLEQSFLNYHIMIIMESLSVSYLRNSMHQASMKLFRKFKNRTHTFLLALYFVLENLLVKNRLKVVLEKFVS
jgi:hypothetical protein